MRLAVVPTHAYFQYLCAVFRDPIQFRNHHDLVYMEKSATDEVSITKVPIKKENLNDDIKVSYK